jgi:hypothetical protein
MGRWAARARPFGLARPRGRHDSRCDVATARIFELRQLDRRAPLLAGVGFALTCGWRHDRAQVVSAPIRSIRCVGSLVLQSIVKLLLKPLDPLVLFNQSVLQPANHLNQLISRRVGHSTLRAVKFARIRWQRRS